MFQNLVTTSVVNLDPVGSGIFFPDPELLVASGKNERADKLNFTSNFSPVDSGLRNQPNCSEILGLI